MRPVATNLPSQHRPRPIRDGLRFLGGLLRNPRSVGSVLPSSRFLADAIVGELKLTAGDVVVEYGPGTGPMTAAIHRRMPDGVKYLGIELNPRFHGLLTERYPELDFHLGSASEVAGLLKEKGLPRPRRIISGLPFASLPQEVQDGVVDATAEVLAEDGEFRTFQYVHAYALSSARRFRSRMAEKFGGFKRSAPVIRNVPPAYVLTYTHLC